MTVLQGQILVGGAAVLEAAVEAKNGRLYVMDGVLVPASIRPLLPHRCDVTESRIIKVGSSSICWSVSVSARARALSSAEVAPGGSSDVSLQGECVSCSRVRLAQCPSGVPTVRRRLRFLQEPAAQTLRTLSPLLRASPRWGVSTRCPPAILWRFRPQAAPLCVTPQSR